MAAPAKDISSRLIACDLLTAVLVGRQPLDEAMVAAPGFMALAPRDRAFVHRLVAMTLRRLGEIDRLLARCLEKPLPTKADLPRQALRIGAAQLLFLKTPAHAAVDGSVALMSGAAGAGYRGLVNAVLRRLAREGGPRLATIPDGAINTPDWLWQRWCLAYSETTAQAIAASHLTPPPLDLSIKGDPAPWAERLGARLLPGGTVRLPDETAFDRDLPGYAAGDWWVQDAAAAMPARALGALTPGAMAGRTILDLCAAPGGKTAQLAAAGARVIALDRSAKRLERLAQNLKRLDLPAETIQADATQWRPPEDLATAIDGVLLDAPCSATGTIRRHPDLPWIKRPEDIAKLTALQMRMLRQTVAWMRPGMRLIYCVCSLEPEEGPALLAGALAEGLPLQREPILGAEIGADPEMMTPLGELRSLPCQRSGAGPEAGGLDGFFAARLKRV